MHAFIKCFFCILPFTHAFSDGQTHFYNHTHIHTGIKWPTFHFLCTLLYHLSHWWVKPPSRKLVQICKLSQTK